jgi:hypothetical protein
LTAGYLSLDSATAKTFHCSGFPFAPRCDFLWPIPAFG